MSPQAGAAGLARVQMSQCQPLLLSHVGGGTHGLELVLLVICLMIWQYTSSRRTSCPAHSWGQAQLPPLCHPCPGHPQDSAPQWWIYLEDGADDVQLCLPPHGVVTHELHHSWGQQSHTVTQVSMSLPQGRALLGGHILGTWSTGTRTKLP